MNTKNLKINDPVCSSISIRENNEPLVDILEIERVLLPSQTKIISENIDGDSNTPLVRLTVKKLLVKALSELPQEYGIVFIEGYRRYEYQKKLFQNYVKKIIKEQRLPLEKAEIVASQFVSNPDIFSPHVTGGAIDIGLIYVDSKKLVDVGNNFTYDDSAKTDYSKLTKTQKENRQLLIDLMTNAGFTNYPFEWWHWSYGDNYWAYVKKRRFAIYKTLKMLK